MLWGMLQSRLDRSLIFSVLATIFGRAFQVMPAQLRRQQWTTRNEQFLGSDPLFLISA